MPASLYGLIRRFALATLGFGIIRQARAHLGGDAARNQLQDFQTDVDRQLVGSIGDLLIAIAALLASPGDGFINQLAIFSNLGCIKDQQWVGSSILRLIQLHCRDIARIRNYCGELAQSC